MTIANQIKSYRTKEQLSQTQFANLIGATQGLINHWESGRQQPSARMAITIEKATQGAINRTNIRPDLFN